MTKPVFFQGAMRVFFNAHSAYPLVWTIQSVDGEWEVDVPSVAIHIVMESKYDATPQLPDHSGPPCAWFEGSGDVYVGEDGRAVIMQDMSK